MEIKKEYYNSAQNNNKKAEAKWWTFSKEEACHHVVACATSIENRQSYRRNRNTLHARMYSNQVASGLSSNIYASQRKATGYDARVTLNVVKACIDTVSAKIGKNRPRPLFLTEQGNSAQQRRAKKLTQYVMGEFDRISVYKKGQLSFRDAGIFGTGCLKIYEADNKIQVERVLIDEIIVDDSEAIYGEPRTLYQRKFIPREVLLEAYGTTPDVEHKIMSAQAVGKAQLSPEHSEYSDMVYVVEGWHLPSSSKAKDGAHIISIEGQTLFFEEYKKDKFPFVMLHWTEPVIGFYGAGIVEEILGCQLEINKLLRDIQHAQHRMCAPQIWLEHSSHVSKPITNEFGAIYRYSGQPPKFYAPAAMSSEVYNHIWNIYRRAFEIVGVSEMSATLRKPAGLESRAALREYNDIETERFAIIAQAYEKFFMDVAEIIVDLSKEIYKDNKDLATNVPGKRFLETISWKDVDMDKDEYVMQVFPTSFLPSTPSGKIDRVTEMIEKGLIPQEYALSLLDFPDIEGVLTLETVNLENLRRILDNIIEKGEYQEPEEFMDLNLAVKMAQQYYLKGQMDGLEPEKLKMLRMFTKQSLTLLQSGQPSMPSAQQMPQLPVQPNQVMQ